MPAYSFKFHFVKPIRSGEKFTTIRGIRRRPTVPGDDLALYTGQRTPLCFKIADAPCISTSPIIIYPGLNQIYWKIQDEPFKIPISSKELADTIRADGFAAEADFFKFFTLYKRYMLDNFEIVRWDPSKLNVPAPGRNEILSYKKFGGKHD